MRAQALESCRLYALAALLFGAAGAVIAVIATVIAFPSGLLAALCLVLVAAGAWVALLKTRWVRFAGVAVSGLAAAAACWLLLGQRPGLTLLPVIGIWLGVFCARRAFRMRLTLPAAARPRHGVLFYNPRSGGGKAARFHLADEARARGLEPIELTAGSDLATLVRDAIAAGADGMAMAGGDGSQAIVAALASSHGLPYACIPAGTRNHFALDLGVDRDDVVGALDALVDGGERVVDLAEVNGRVFVNNVSLGVYGEAVQKQTYRGAKLRTLLGVLSQTTARGSRGPLRWREPDGSEHHEESGILISNDPYRLGGAIRSGTRPRLDRGRLGVAVYAVPRPGEPRTLREWTVDALEVASEGPVPAGIDGEAVMLQPPLAFRSRPAALRVRIARHHPGASPSALEPGGLWEALKALAGIAVGHDPRPLPAGAGTGDRWVPA
jgi:diacylglycerol kinase family enzyme